MPEDASSLTMKLQGSSGDYTNPVLNVGEMPESTNPKEYLPEDHALTTFRRLYSEALERQNPNAINPDLIIVGGHAVLTDNVARCGGDRADILPAENLFNPESPQYIYDSNNWVRQNFQPPRDVIGFVDHVLAGIAEAAASNSVLAFSGGATREGSTWAEAASCFYIADSFFSKYFHELEEIGVGVNEFAERMIYEGMATDTPTNILLSTSEFYNKFKRLPEKCRMITWGFKKERIDELTHQMRMPGGMLEVLGVGVPAGDVHNGGNGARGETAAVQALHSGTDNLSIPESVRGLCERRNQHAKQIQQRHEGSPLFPVIKFYTEAPPGSVYEGRYPWEETCRRHQASNLLVVASGSLPVVNAA